MGKVKRGDARLSATAIGLAFAFLSAELPDDRQGGIEEQKKALGLNYERAFKAVAGNMERGGRDVEGIWRIVRKARAVKEREG